MLAMVAGCLGVAVPATGRSDDRSGTIRGTVLNEHGEPVAGARVDARSSVRIRFKVDISRLLPLWKEGRAVGTPLHTRCTDVGYDDNPQEYVVRQPSPEAVSGSGFGVSLRP